LISGILSIRIKPMKKAYRCIHKISKRSSSISAALILLTAAIVVSGCGRARELVFGDEGFGGRYTESDAPAREYAPEPEASRAKAALAEELAADRKADDAPAGTTVESDQTAAKPEQKEERKRIYSGYAELLVGDVEEQKKNIADIAEKSGGYVESMYESTVIVRVPAEQFNALFARILDLGEILHRSIETMDVTEYFQDLTSRLEIASTTRERLYRLLEKTWNVEERLRILREIKRLTEEIERIGLTLTLLERQIAFSRISVDLVPRLAQEQMTRDQIPFRWIANLDPLYRTLKPVKGKIDLQLSDEFAVFEQGLTLFESIVKRGSVFRAESFEGTRVRVGSAENEPEGDAAFWQEALNHHLSKYYRKAEKMELGALQSVLFASKDKEPFSYLLGVLQRGKRLVVVEVFFPNPDALKDRLEEIKSALEEFKVR
jgi:hypothetical protein